MRAYIDLAVIASFSVCSAQLRCYVHGGPDIGREIRISASGRVCHSPGPQSLAAGRQTKVTNLRVSVGVDENIFRLEIPVDYAFFVNVSESTHNTAKHFPSLLRV